MNEVHILLVEDNDADIELTRDMLSLAKYDIKLSVARDGMEALELLNNAGSWSLPGLPTLVLLDLNLPRKHGRQVLSVIKTHDELKRIPVVMLSSSESEQDITSCYHLGANCYMVKPSNLEGYRATMKSLEEFWLGAARLPRRDGHSTATAIGFKG
jgi:two-component system response regulator